MEVYKNGIAIYTGGGIVSDSELESEWQETEMKADTLLVPLAIASGKIEVK